ncbi:alginate lyase family protein [Dyadobacter sp. CY343]
MPGCFKAGLAWYFTNESKYSEHAAQLLRVWFLDEMTKMNPNLNFG